MLQPSSASRVQYGRMLHPGMTAVSIGSTLPEQREVDVSAVEVCDLIVCDAVAEVLNETGDMLAARAEKLDVHEKTVSLNALLSNQCDERVTAAKLVMFKSVGSGRNRCRCLNRSTAGLPADSQDD